MQTEKAGVQFKPDHPIFAGFTPARQGSDVSGKPKVSRAATRDLVQDFRSAALSSCAPLLEAWASQVGISLDWMVMMVEANLISARLDADGSVWIEADAQELSARRQ